MSPERPHILRDFDDALQELAKLVNQMASQTLFNLERAVTALIQRDVDLCRAVIADDNDVDEAERQIDALGMDMLVRFHPVAGDLRQVLSSMKVAASLERISDHAVNIAKRGKKVLVSSELTEMKLIEPLYSLADDLLKTALQSYSERDTQLGASVKTKDKELDLLYKEQTNRISDLLEQGGEQTTAYMHLIFVIRSLERVGDLAVNIGEDAVFLDSAEDIRYISKKKVAKIVEKAVEDE